MSNINDRVAYLKGLAEGMKLTDETNEGKLLLKMLDAMQDMAEEITALRKDHDELDEYVESIDDDLADMEEYLYDDEALERYRRSHKGSFTLQRYKGLGEMNAHQLWETTMNPDTRILRQVNIENAAEADRIFSMLMGDEVPPRREFIERNAHYANIDA